MFLKSKFIPKILLFLLCISFFFTPATVRAQPKKQVILLIADYLTLADLESPEASFLRKLGLSGAIGLMNTNTAISARTSPHTHATISAGRPAQGGSNNILASRTQEMIEGELACTTFQRYTGYLLDDQEIVILNWPQILKANQSQGRTAPLPGSLGNLLQNASLSIAVFGNSDTPTEPHRPAVLIASNLAGIIASGEIGADILKPSQGLLPWRTDYNKLLAKITEAIPSTDFLVVDLGDLHRLETMQYYGLDRVVKKERETIIRDINTFAQELVSKLDMDNALLILGSTTPSAVQAQKKNYLVPVMMTSSYMDAGILYSNTTRRAGLITNTDLTASILAFLNVDPSTQMTGQPAIGVNLTGSEPLTYLRTLNDRMVFTYQIRPLLVKPYVVLQIIAIGLCVPLFFTLRRLIPYYRYWLGLLVAFPAALLVVGTFTHQGLTAYTIASVVLSGVFVSLSFRYNTTVSPITPFILLSAVTASLIIFDLTTGSSLMQQSVLGFDPIAGARYYGIGNEFMGVLIGSSFLGMGVIFQQKDRPIYVLLAVLYFGLLIWLMVATDYGANLGGTIAALSAVLFWFWRWKKEFLKRHLIFGLLLAIIFIAFLAIAGLGITSNNLSHIGRTLYLIQQEGIGELIDIIVRKGQMNLKLIRYTPWSRVFLLALSAMGVLFFKPTGFFRRLCHNHRPVYEAILAILVGSVTALIWNDSGIVAAATTMIYGVYPLLGIALEEPFITYEEASKLG